MSTCAACGGDSEPVVTLHDEPVCCNARWEDAASARAVPRASIDLVRCCTCGAAWNRAFDPRLVVYDARYESSLFASPAFRDYARDLARRLVVERGLHGGRILEVGAGGGELLDLLCRVGGPGTTGVGFDPGAPRAARPSGAPILVPEELPATDAGVDPDLVVCRHVLEHVADPHGLLAAIAAQARRETVVYLEVPDAAYMVNAGAVWDVIHEHPWYFTASSLVALAGAAGFTVEACGTGFGGQYLWLEAVVGGSASRDGHTVLVGGGDRVAEAWRAFGARVEAAVSGWAAWLAARGADPVALWGVGSKGTTFLNRVPGGTTVTAVDASPPKWGTFVAGTGQPIVDPASLRASPPAAVVVLNPRYEAEIAVELARLGLSAAAVVTRAGVEDAPARR